MRKILNIKNLVLSIILLSIFSCEKNGWEEVFENNQLVERTLYESDKILIIEKYDKGQIEFITRYYPSGNVKELGPMNTEKNKDGLWKTYYDDGTLKSEEFFIDNILVIDGIHKTYYSDGTLKSEESRKDYLKDGTWKTFYPNGVLKDYINYKKDELHGSYKTYNDGGDLTGEETYKNGILNGPYQKFFYPSGSTPKIQEKGEFKNGVQHGNWEYYNSISYTIWYSETRFKKVKRHVMINEGPFIDGKKNGIWTYHTYSDCGYSGCNHKKESITYNNDIKNGPFTIDSPSSLADFVEGTYLDGVLHGSYTGYMNVDSGKYIGNKYIAYNGQYEKGVKVGFWTEYKNEGNYNSDGQRDGVWKTYCDAYPKRLRLDEERFFKDGYLHGPYSYKKYEDCPKGGDYYKTEKLSRLVSEFTYLNNTIDDIEHFQNMLENMDGPFNLRKSPGSIYMYQEGTYKKGKLEEERTYHENGQLKIEETFTNGNFGTLLDGPRKVYYENGELYIESIYQDGEIVESKTFYRNGTLESEEFYVVLYKYGKSKKHGIWKTYYNDGTLKSEKSYDQGKKNGLFKEYNSSGKLISKEEYIMDAKIN